MTTILPFIEALKRLRRSSASGDEQLQTIYYKMIEIIILGKYEEVAEGLKELRDPEFSKDDDIEAVRRLITIRLSMKRGDPGENVSWLNFPVKENSWLMAEKLLAQAHWNYHLQLFDEGTKLFQEAAKKFEPLKMHGREFVSTFNSIIGEINGSNALTPQMQLEKLRALELKVKPHSDDKDCARVQALIYRQKAHAFEDLNRLHASLEEISKAILVFELIGPASDYHLALLHAADISLDIKDEFKARAFFEYIITPVDARVEFPMAFVNWRLGGELPDKKNFSILPGGWIEKFEKLSSSSQLSNTGSEWTWIQTTGVISGDTLENSLVIKPASLEGRLIRILAQEKATKNFLIEALWPQQSEVHLVDNRLHRMISRLNKKLNNSILYDGKYYSLHKKILLK